MNSAAITIIACLWAQAPGEGEKYEPQLRPAHKAPAVRLEEAPAFNAPADKVPADKLPADKGPADKVPADEAPAEDAPATQVRHDGQPHDRYGAAEEERRGPLHVGRSDDPEADERMAPVDSQAKQKLRPPELLAEALETLRSGAIVGTPLSLQAALARSTDRQHQLRIAQTYWRLCTAQADYHWARDHRDLLGQYTQSETNHPGMLSARASARADVRDAQLAVAEAQQELSDLIGARADASPPLASDRPHVGDYNTHYESIFTSRVPPPRIRLIHRVLPGRRKAIDAHAEAIVASLDALETTGEDFQQHGRGLATVLAMLEQLKRERRAFSEDVRAYNQEIAEYAFAVAPPGANGETLVSMLIKTTPRSQDPPRNRSGSRSPSRADQGDSRLERSARDETAAREQMANYQAADDENGVYQGLLAVESPLRVQKLANLLHWDRNLPPDGSEPATLAECLRGVPATRRMNVISAFWRAREQAARYQAFADQVEQLAALPALAIDQRHEPGLGVRVQATRRAARAALADAHIQLLAGEFELTEAVGRRFDDPWLLPSTPPQSGRYHVAVDSRSVRGAPSPRLGGLVRVQHEKLEERADGVIQADVQRAALMTRTRRAEPASAAHPAADADEPLPLDVALRAIARQNEETLTFLHDLTEYNMAIAHFALAVWPASISNDELVKKLVIARSTRRDS